MHIDTVVARSILDTRGRPTIEATLSAGILSATASVPSGKSTGSHEAVELRDTDGSVTHEIENENSEIAGALTSRDFASPDELDTFLIELDGTPNKSRLGANEILSVSITAQRLFALEEGVPLWQAISKRAGEGSFLRVTMPSAAFPTGKAERSQETSFPSEHQSPRLYVNVMNGGVHADFKLPFQEYILVVEGATSQALPIAQEAFAKLGERLGNVPMGDEGGYAPTFDTLEQPFEILAELVKEFPGTSIAIDAAASELFHDGHYELLGKSYSAEELTTIYGSTVARFPIHSIEDPFDENAPDDFTRLTATLGLPAQAGEQILIVGDDLTVTNPSRIKEAVARKEINAVLIKPNQIGTVREAIQAVQETYAAGWQAIASHRSGETDDTFIADFAYGIGAHGIKAGGLGQHERLEKYERLLTIEREAKTM